LNDEEIKDQCATFLLVHASLLSGSNRKNEFSSNTHIQAGSDTTSNTLAYVVYLLAQHPDVERKLVNEINEKLGDKVRDNRPPRVMASDRCSLSRSSPTLLVLKT